MRSFSPEFEIRMQSAASTVCLGWKLTRKDGAVFGFTDHDRDIELNSVIYQARSGFSPKDIDASVGFALDTSAVSGLLSSDMLIADDIKAGLYDGARIEVFLFDWQNPTTNAKIWQGQIGRLTQKDGGFEAELLGPGAALERSVGRVFSRQCDASFGDERCGLNANDYPAQTTCPRSFSACRDQFQNTANFRGFPYLIGDDAVYRAPQSGEVFNGGSRFGGGENG